MLKKICVYSILLFAFLCIIPEKANAFGTSAIEDLTNLDLKELQVRTYPNINTETMLKTVINVLQDDYFFIENADSKIGYILASREFDTKNPNIKISDEFGCPKLITYIKRYSTARTEATISISSLGKGSSVRLNIRKKVYNIYNVNARVKEITDAKVYNHFFKDLDSELRKQNQI